MYFFKTGLFRPNQSRLDRFRSVNRFIRWTGPVTGSGFKNIAPTSIPHHLFTCLRSQITLIVWLGQALVEST